MQRLDLVCSKDEMKPALNYVKLNKDEVVASDGHVLVIHKTINLFGEDFVNSLPNKDLFIHRTDWKIICKSTVIRYEYNEGQISTFNKKGDLLDIIVLYDNEKVVKYPDLHLAVPSLCNETPSVIGINSKLLYDLTLAIYSDKNDSLLVDLKCSKLDEYGRSFGAMRVIPSNQESDLYNSDVIAVIMPVLNNKL
jgi:hypothetical protein